MCLFIHVFTCVVKTNVTYFLYKKIYDKWDYIKKKKTQITILSKKCILLCSFMPWSCFPKE